MTLHASRPPRPDNGNSSGQKRHIPKGHDRILDTAQRSGNHFTVILGSGEKLEGKLVGRDKFTMTLQMENGTRRTIFKHAIDYFFEDVSAQTENGAGAEIH